VYDRTHTRQLAELEAMHLSKRLPFAAWAFVICGHGVDDCRDSQGFVAEFAGAGRRVDCAALVETMAAGVGIVVGVAYTWRALQKAFFSDALPRPHVLGVMSRDTVRSDYLAGRLPACRCW